ADGCRGRGGRAPLLPPTPSESCRSRPAENPRAKRGLSGRRCIADPARCIGAADLAMERGFQPSASRSPFLFLLVPAPHPSPASSRAGGIEKCLRALDRRVAEASVA